MDKLSPNLKKGQSKRSSFILRSAQVLSKKLILKKENKIQTESDENGNKEENESKTSKITPIVSQKEKMIRKIDRPMGEIKQIANYGDVVLELKQKFSSMTMLNAIVWTFKEQLERNTNWQGLLHISIWTSKVSPNSSEQ